MTRTGGGSIVLIGSMTSVRVSLPGQAAYATSKGGVLMLGKALAVDLAAAGIRVNVILPGVTDTPLGGLSKLDDEATEDLLSRVPSRRVAQPEDVAAVAAFLASPAARHVTGAAIPVDGGQLALTSPFPFV